MGRHTKLLVLTLGSALAWGSAQGCGRSQRPRKESGPTRKAERARPRPGPREGPRAEAAARDTMDPALRKLLAMLDSRRASRRKAALNRLAAIKFEDPQQARPALKAIRARLEDENPDVRSLAGLAILKLEGKEGSAYVRPLLKDPSEEVRATVLNELGKLGKDFRDDLMAGLEDPSPDIQEIVLDHLSRQHAKRADALAVRLYEKTGVERLRAQILDYLIKVKSDRGTAAVQKHLDDLENGSTLRLAVRYLGQHGKIAQVKKLVTYLNDLEIGVRKEAAQVMARRNVKTLDAISGLVHLLNDDETEVRVAAHEALKKLTNQDFGFDPEEFDAKKVAPALEKWEAWLEKNSPKLPKN